MSVDFLRSRHQEHNKEMIRFCMIIILLVVLGAGIQSQDIPVLIVTDTNSNTKTVTEAEAAIQADFKYYNAELRNITRDYIKSHAKWIACKERYANMF